MFFLFATMDPKNKIKHRYNYADSALMGQLWAKLFFAFNQTNQSWTLAVSWNMTFRKVKKYIKCPALHISMLYRHAGVRPEFASFHLSLSLSLSVSFSVGGVAGDGCVWEEILYWLICSQEDQVRTCPSYILIKSNEKAYTHTQLRTYLQDLSYQLTFEAIWNYQEKEEIVKHRGCCHHGLSYAYDLV